MADSDAAIAAWKPVFAKAVASIGAASYVGRRVPIIGGSGGLDLGYFAVWDDATSYAKGNAAFLRITSYNVCYTKLLRDGATATTDLEAREATRIWCGGADLRSCRADRLARFVLN